MLEAQTPRVALIRLRRLGRRLPVNVAPQPVTHLDGLTAPVQPLQVLVRNGQAGEAEEGEGVAFLQDGKDALVPLVELAGKGFLLAPPLQAGQVVGLVVHLKLDDAKRLVEAVDDVAELVGEGLGGNGAKVGTRRLDSAGVNRHVLVEPHDELHLGVDLPAAPVNLRPGDAQHLEALDAGLGDDTVVGLREGSVVAGVQAHQGAVDHQRAHPLRLALQLRIDAVEQALHVEPPRVNLSALGNSNLSVGDDVAARDVVTLDKVLEQAHQRFDLSGRIRVTPVIGVLQFDAHGEIVDIPAVVGRRHT